MALNSLQDLYVQQLQDLYDAEKQIIDALPKLRRAAVAQELQQAFEQHLDQTRQHVSRLEQVFQNLGMKPTGEKCKAMQGLVKEGEEIMGKKADSSVLDAALIATAQRVEHYEIAGYGSVRTWAQQLGREDDARLLQQTLDEEGETDHKLTQIAERTINPAAKA